MVVYKVILITAIICIGIGIVKKPKRMKLNNFYKINRDKVVIKKLDKILFTNKHLLQIKENYVTKLQIINLKSYEFNDELVIRYLLYDTIISILLLIILSTVITMWYAAITISFVFFYIVIFLGVVYIRSKISKIHDQFSVALQCFIDRYIIHKNIKEAINSYSKMPVQIGVVFELLARELSGGENYEKSIKKFANELSYVWGYAFAEILLLSYEGAGDIAEDLLTLNSMVSEEITAEEEEKSSRYGNEMTFTFVYAAALIGILVNLLINDLAKHLYFYTSTGNALIAVWLIVLTLGITIISLSERGR